MSMFARKLRRRPDLERLEDRLVLTGDRPDVDLVVTDAEAPSTARRGDVVSVSWTVTNEGSETAAVPGWTDVIWLSEDDQLDPFGDTWLGDFTHDNTPTLGPGEAYSHSREVGLEIGLPAGNYFLLVAADLGVNGGTQPETNENDVWSRPFIVTDPQVDLVVTDVNAQATAPRGGSIDVSWTVTNDGTEATTADYWFDRVYLSLDTTLDLGDEMLAEYFRSNSQPLGASENYLASRTVGFSAQANEGTYYLLFETSSDRFTGRLQAETDETNNVTWRAIDLVTPDVDLVVTVAEDGVPSPLLIGSTESVSYTITNQGGEATPNAVLNVGVYYSEDGVYDPATDLPAGWHDNVGVLAPGESLTFDPRDVVVPGAATPGPRYLFFVVNPGSYQAETDEDNNIFRVPVTLIAPDVDLRVTDLTAAAEGVLGGPLHVSWTVRNDGSTRTTAPFRYEVAFLSDDTVLSEDDYALGLVVGGLVGAGEGGAAEYDFFLPGWDGLVGDKYLLFMTDLYDDQVETDDGNNLSWVPITLRMPDVDLVATDAEIQGGGAVAGSSAWVRFAIQNQGGDAAQAFLWHDNLYLSADDQFDASDVQATSLFHFNSGLGSGESYEGEAFFHVPDQPGETMYLLVVPNEYGDQSETRAGDFLALPFTIVPPGADLTGTNVEAPAVLGAGDAFELSWTVRNAGHLATNAYAWYDVV